MLKAFGVEVCGDLIAKRALLSALFSKVTSDAAAVAAAVAAQTHICIDHLGVQQHALRACLCRHV